MLDWLRLVRLPNHATAVADTLAGYLIVSQARSLDWPPAACWLAIAATIAFYAAGMVLNDVYDLELDRSERPERPLPRGTIPARQAGAVGFGLLASGLALACGVAGATRSPWPAAIGVMLAAAVWFYDRHAKRTPLGPAVMGGCRGLNWLLGMTAAGMPASMVGSAVGLIPLGMTAYVAGITLYARDEAGRSRRPMLVAGMLLMLAGFGITAAAVVRSPAATAAGPLSPANWLLLWSLLGTSILLRAVQGVVDPSPGRVRSAVGNAIMSIITLDAVLVLAFCGERWAIVVLSLLGIFLFGRQIVPPT
jgi:4-hydroxybenzoate polyprenyltransferase